MNVDLEISRVENEVRQLEQAKSEKTAHLLSIQRIEADAQKKLSDAQRDMLNTHAAVKKIDDTIYQMKRVLTHLRQDQRTKQGGIK